MERVVREAERTGRAAVEQAYVQRLPKSLTAGPAATALRHLKLWYCMVPDGALPPLGGTGTRCDDAQATGEREGLATGEGHSTPQVPPRPSPTQKMNEPHVPYAANAPARCGGEGLARLTLGLGLALVLAGAGRGIRGEAAVAAPGVEPADQGARGPGATWPLARADS